MEPTKTKEHFLSVAKEAQSIRVGELEMNMLARMTAFEASKSPEDKTTKSQVLRDIIRQAYYDRVPRMDATILKLTYKDLKK